MVGQLDGYRVLEPSASNGEEALTLIDSLKPDIVLLDIRMPGLDGLQVAARLCEREAPPAVIFCTAHDEFALEAFRSAPWATWSSRCAARPGRGVEESLATEPRATGRADQAPASGGSGPRSHISARTRKGRADPAGRGDLLHCRPQVRDLAPCAGRGAAGRAVEGAGRRVRRIHRNALVARERIERLQRTPLGHFQLYLKGLDGDALTVSRRHVAGVRRLMHQL